MNADKHPARPRTLTMMGGPIDAEGADRGQHAGDAAAACLVPAERRRHRADDLSGCGAESLSGFLQLAGFMTMNLGSHLISHWEMFKHLVVGDDESADATRGFYDEYLSVCDMTAEFYLQTVDVVFQQHLLPRAARASRPEGRSRRSRTRRCWRSRASATTSAASARPRRRSTWRPALRPQRSNITWPGTSAITASSTAASGARRSRPWSKGSSPRTAKAAPSSATSGRPSRRD